MKKPTEDDVNRAFLVAAGAAAMHRLDFKSAVRRVLGNSDWKHDPERLAAAEAKRARKNAKRACR
jgi:hypothetical protein